MAESQGGGQQFNMADSNLLSRWASMMETPMLGRVDVSGGCPKEYICSGSSRV